MKIKSPEVEAGTLTDSQIFREASQLLEDHNFRKGNHGQRELMKSAAILKKSGFHQVGELKKTHPQVFLIIQRCVSHAIGSVCHCVKTLAGVIAKIVETLEHPSSAAKDMLEIAKAFCAELARRLFQDARTPA